MKYRSRLVLAELVGAVVLVGGCGRCRNGNGWPGPKELGSG